MSSQGESGGVGQIKFRLEIRNWNIRRKCFIQDKRPDKRYSRKKKDPLPSASSPQIEWKQSEINKFKQTIYDSISFEKNGFIQDFACGRKMQNISFEEGKGIRLQL